MDVAWSFVFLCFLDFLKFMTFLKLMAHSWRSLWQSSGKVWQGTNHAFLHGLETAVPGSWNEQKLECGNSRCQGLLNEKATPKKIHAEECGVCRDERASKARVVDDLLFAKQEFTKAKAIFATNAVKYHVNKLRAKAWAAEHRQPVQYAIAKDAISSVALREKLDLGAEKLSWLQRHDQDCGALYGVLPLCVGMPVTATDHLDRGRGILRGCAGVVVGWVWPADAAAEKKGENGCVWNQLPACILVRFDTKESWRIQCVSSSTAKKTLVP